MLKRMLGQESLEVEMSMKVCKTALTGAVHCSKFQLKVDEVRRFNVVHFGGFTN